MRRALVLSLTLGLTTSAAVRADDVDDRCAVRVKRQLDAGALARARRTLDRCAWRSPSDSRWAHLVATWIPTSLDRLEAPDDALREDLTRARALADAAPDPSLDRERAWWRFVADGTFELEIGPQDPAGVTLLRRVAALSWRRGRVEDAERALRRAHRVMPQDPETARDLAALLVARGRAEEGVALLGNVRAAHPADRGLKREHALALLAAGRGDDALVIFEALARDDEAGLDTLRLASAALELGHATRAESAARRALERLDPSAGAEAHAVRGLALLALGRRDEAREALRLGSDDLRARSALAALEAP
ncbi:MAG: hypothetical protein R3B99_02070 [Polyangiales bacterium]